MGVERSSGIGRVLLPIHGWIWGDPDRRARKLFAFAAVETDGGRDILRAAEMTPDPLLRRLYLAHAIDELHHGDLFRERGSALLRSRPQLFPSLSSGAAPAWLPADGHGIDDLRIEEERDESLLSFLHLSEKSAAGRFLIYREIVQDDPATHAIFDEILRDEVFHMNYTYAQLARISPASHRRRLWWARISRLWKQYLRVAAAVARVISTIVLTVQYFILIPPFAWLARRAERREQPGWIAVQPESRDALTRQY